MEYLIQYKGLLMSKQNQGHQHLYRPFPYQNPQSKAPHSLGLDSNCDCPPCKSRPQLPSTQIFVDRDLQLLRNKSSKSKSTYDKNKQPQSDSKMTSSRNRSSDFIIFLNQIYKYSNVALPNLQILDTIVFNADGSVKYIVTFDSGKLRISKLSTSLKTFITQRKYNSDLQFQKKKFQRQHMGFSFTQLDHQSQKYIKQFQNNIKFMNPLLNRVVITKSKQKQQQQILSMNQVNGVFVKISRKLFDFTNMEYLQIFPVMYGHEESSYVRKVKYFREREIHNRNFKIAQHYVGNWYVKNQTLQNMQFQFVNSIKNNQQQLLMYYTYKLFIFFQKVSNKMVQNALLSYITNDEGNSFHLKNIQCLNLFNLHEVEQRVHELPKKLDNQDPHFYVDLKKQMKTHFDSFQLNYSRLERQRIQMEDKLKKDVDFSNQVYQSLGNKIPKYNKSSSFIKSICDKHNGVEEGKILINEEASSSKHL